MNDTIIFYMIRHAPVIGQKGRIYGDDVNIDLESHHDTIAQLAAQIPGTDKALWLCSGVDRTVRTGERILNAIGGDIQKMHVMDYFREQNFGDLIGKSHSEAHEFIEWHNESMYVPSPPNGESIPVLIDRVRVGIHLAAQKAIKNHHEKVVIISHRGTIRAANIAIHQKPVSSFMDIDIAPLSMMTFYQSVLK